jgi:SagB-type dehydrogenase family enzyme
MSSKKRLLEIINNLSEDECKEISYLLNAANAGNKYWEDDIALAYNEYVKMRIYHMKQGFPLVSPALYTDEGLPSIPLPSIIKKHPTNNVVKLPQPSVPSVEFFHTISSRRSRRDYNEEKMTKEELSAILHYTAGISTRVSGYGLTQFPLRMFPSSGGLQSPEVYVSSISTEELDPGIYHYQPTDHSLELIRKGQFGNQLQQICIGQEYVKRSALIMIITGSYERLRWKYNERSYRYLCVDAGTLVQNTYLVTNALGLGACAIAGFIDDQLSHLLELNTEKEIPLVVMTIGRIMQSNS